jgi:hypothetical protein
MPVYVYETGYHPAVQCTLPHMMCLLYWLQVHRTAVCKQLQPRSHATTPTRSHTPTLSRSDAAALPTSGAATAPPAAPSRPARGRATPCRRSARLPRLPRDRGHSPPNPKHPEAAARQISSVVLSDSGLSVYGGLCGVLWEYGRTDFSKARWDRGRLAAHRRRRAGSARRPPRAAAPGRQHRMAAIHPMVNEVSQP